MVFRNSIYSHLLPIFVAFFGGPSWSLWSKNLYWHPGSYNDTVDDITAIAVGDAWGMVRLLV